MAKEELIDMSGIFVLLAIGTAINYVGIYART